MRRMRMDLCNILDIRERWQEETFENIKRKLVLYRDDSKFQNASDHPLVMLYSSEPQVGKTTLILTMIGLKEEFIPTVDAALRIDGKGNSSTATATIYHKSENDYYGFSMTSIEAVDDAIEDIEYCEETEVHNKIREIREGVEHGQADEEKVRHIYIPAKYFQDEKEIKQISIIDMPGVGSRNLKEEAHVTKLMAKFVPIASVCILVYIAMQFDAIRSEKLPQQVNWKMRDDKFIIVTTKSYIAGNTKSYFKKEHPKREVGFYDYIKKSTDQLFKDGEILPVDSKMEIYPLDMGETFDRLCNKEITDPEDVTEVKKTRDRIIRELRESILSRKGNKLKAAVKELKENISQYAIEKNEKICEELEEIEERIKECEKCIKKIKENQEKFEPSCGEEDSDEIDLRVNALQEKLNGIKLESMKSVCDSFWRHQSDGREGDIYPYSIKAGIIDDMKVKFTGDLANRICRWESEIKGIEEDLENIKHQKEDFVQDRRRIRETMLNYIQFEADEIFKRKKFFKLKITADQMTDFASTLEGKWTNMFPPFKEKLGDAISRIQQENRDEIDRARKLQSKLDGQIQRLEQEKNELEERKKELDEDREELDKIQQSNNKTVEMYKAIAAETFCKCRDSVVRQINNPMTTAEGKMGYVILLGILDKDYSSIIGGINNGENY